MAGYHLFGDESAKAEADLAKARKKLGALQVREKELQNLKGVESESGSVPEESQEYNDTVEAVLLAKQEVPGLEKIVQELKNKAQTEVQETTPFGPEYTDLGGL